MLLESITAIGLTFASYHFDKDPLKTYNERNPGVVVEVDNVWLAGIYKNTFDRTTVFAARNVQLLGDNRLGLSIIAGLASGYPQPIVASLRFQSSHFDILLIPPTGANSGVVAGILKWSL